MRQSDASFFEAILPEIAVISLGNDNSHHHPNREALQRLVAAGVYRIFQTSWGTTEGVIPPDVRRHVAAVLGLAGWGWWLHAGHAEQENHLTKHDGEIAT